MNKQFIKRIDSVKQSMQLKGSQFAFIELTPEGYLYEGRIYSEKDLESFLDDLKFDAVLIDDVM